MKGRHLMFSFYTAQLMDSVSTYIGLTTSRFMEYNPLVRTLIIKFGMIEALLVKLFVAGILISLYAFTLRKNHRLLQPMELALQIAGVGTIGIVLWNVTMLATR